MSLGIPVVLGITQEELQRPHNPAVSLTITRALPLRPYRRRVDQTAASLKTQRDSIRLCTGDHETGRLPPVNQA